MGPPVTTAREVGCTPARDLDADAESESASKRATLLSGRLGRVVRPPCMAECRALKPSDTEGNVRRATKSVISPESDAEMMRYGLCLANLSGTPAELKCGKVAETKIILIVSQSSHTLLRHLSLAMLPSLQPSTKHLAYSAQALFSRLVRSHQRPWQRNATDYRVKYANQLGKVAQQ